MKKTNMKIIGITGPSGSGKSLFRHYLEEKKLPCIDADQVYHEMLIPPSPCLDDLRAAFGNSVFREDGTLDRAALGEIVFHDGEKLKLLNQTVLSRVLDNIRKEIRSLGANGATTVFVDAPTLIESGFHRECQAVISVLAPMELRAERIAQRDGISSEKAYTRIRAQKDDAFYETHSDHVLYNNTDTETFLRQADAVLRAIEDGTDTH